TLASSGRLRRNVSAVRDRLLSASVAAPAPLLSAADSAGLSSRYSAIVAAAALPPSLNTRYRSLQSSLRRARAGNSLRSRRELPVLSAPAKVAIETLGG